MGTIKDVYDIVKNEVRSLSVTDERFLRFCRNYNISMAKKLIQQGADINATDDKCRTALMEAAAKGRLKLVQMLIARQADVNLRDYMGNTTLMRAARNGYPLTTLALIDAGADVNAYNLRRYTALMQAVYSAQPETALILLNNGANTQIMNINGEKAVHFLRHKKSIIAFEGTEALKILQEKEKRAKIRKKAGKK